MNLEQSDGLKRELEEMTRDMCLKKANEIGTLFIDTASTIDQVKDIVQGYNYVVSCMAMFEQWWTDDELEIGINRVFNNKFDSTTVSPDYRECVRKMTLESYKRELRSTVLNYIGDIDVVVNKVGYQAGFITEVIVKLDKKEMQ